MYDTTKVKTFTPHIPAGIGPTCMTAEEALIEIVHDIREQMTDNSKPTDDELNSTIQLIANGLGVNDWIDGEYTIFPGYEVIIETMAKGRLDELPEFNGY